jgi:hypothetical protein
MGLRIRASMLLRTTLPSPSHCPPESNARSITSAYRRVIIIPVYGHISKPGITTRKTCNPRLAPHYASKRVLLCPRTAGCTAASEWDGRLVLARLVPLPGVQVGPMGGADVELFSG